MDPQEQLLVLQSLFQFSFRATHQKTHSVFMSRMLLKPASDTELTKFWNSLRGMEPENGFLNFHIRFDSSSRNNEEALYPEGL